MVLSKKAPGPFTYRKSSRSVGRSVAGTTAPIQRLRRSCSRFKRTFSPLLLLLLLPFLLLLLLLLLLFCRRAEMGRRGGPSLSPLHPRRYAAVAVARDPFNGRPNSNTAVKIRYKPRKENHKPGQKKNIQNKMPTKSIFMNLTFSATGLPNFLFFFSSFSFPSRIFCDCYLYVEL